MKKKNILSLLISVIVSSTVFFLCALILLPAEINLSEEKTPVDDGVSGIPYEYRENAVLLFTFPKDAGALICLNFDKAALEVALYSDNATEQAAKSSYEVDYVLNADYELLCELCDRIGGIELKEGEAVRRYYSAGLRQKLSEKMNLSDKKEIAAAFFEKISKIGLSSEDFKFIIRETETSLSYPVCFGWIDAMKNLAENTVFISQ